MAKITDLTPISPVDRTTDVLIIEDISAGESKKGTVNSILGFTGGNPVSTSDSATLTNKTLDNTNAATLKDNSFTLQDNSDTAKQAVFELSGITTGNTRTYTLPDASTTLVGTGATQTLTNKTLTSPVINTATISNPTLTVDSIAEHTGAAGVTIDGVLLKDSFMNGSYLTASTVTSAKINFGGSGAGVWWEEIARTTLGSAGDTITVSSIPARKYLRFMLMAVATGGTIDTSFRFNNDSGANYNSRGSTNYGAMSDIVGATNILFESGATDSGQVLYGFIEGINILANEKTLISKSMSQDAAGAVVPTTIEYIVKWANTSAQINRFDWTNAGTGDFAIGSEVVVLGHN